ncbi:hypothetical protein [Henriciella aquimarina]|uniref:hypothetical protein n=1 Tax=Henriciella aquimarina TaxID=545261 RepID=UPI0009FE51DE|nr:hypothetical protein [Henriciella aquimarina]
MTERPSQGWPVRSKVSGRLAACLAGMLAIGACAAQPMHADPSGPATAEEPEGLERELTRHGVFGGQAVDYVARLETFDIPGKDDLADVDLAAFSYVAETEEKNRPVSSSSMAVPSARLSGCILARWAQNGCRRLTT